MGLERSKEIVEKGIGTISTRAKEMFEKETEQGTEWEQVLLRFEVILQEITKRTQKEWLQFIETEIIYECNRIELELWKKYEPDIEGWTDFTIMEKLEETDPKEFTNGWLTNQDRRVYNRIMMYRGVIEWMQIERRL